MSDSESTGSGRGRSHSISFSPIEHTNSADQKQQPPVGSPRSSILSLLPSSFNRAAGPSSTSANLMRSTSPPVSTTSSEDEMLRTPGSSPKLNQVKIVGDDVEGLDEMSELNSTWRKNAQYALGRRSSCGDHPTSPVSSWLMGLPTSPTAPKDLDTANSLGLFRRLSLGANTAARKPVWKQPGKSLAVPEQAVVDEPLQEDRLGRGLERRGSATRRLSPMASKMLTGQFY